MTTKLNKTAYSKMVLQAEEARELGLKSLADNVFGAVGAVARDEKITYSDEQLANDVNGALWKVAVDIIAYHDLDSIDIQKVDGVIQAIAGNVIEAIEGELGVSDSVGKLEPKLPGQK